MAYGVAAHCREGADRLESVHEGAGGLVLFSAVQMGALARCLMDMDLRLSDLSGAPMLLHLHPASARVRFRTRH